MPKGLVARKIFCVGGTSNEFQKKWDCNLKETEMKRRGLLLEEYCSKLFSLMDSFWVEIRGKRVDILISFFSFFHFHFIHFTISNKYNANVCVLAN